MTNQQIIICKNILCENVPEKLIIRFVVALQIGSGFYYRPPRKLRKGNSHVCLSMGYPMWPLPIVHWTSPDRNPQPRSAHGTSLHMHPTDGDIWWPRLETCSKFFTWWLLKQIWLASGWYASYWNTFLCVHNFEMCCICDVYTEKQQRQCHMGEWSWLHKKIIA